MKMATLTPQAFVAKWRKVTLKERAAAKEHFLDLYDLLGHPTPAAADAEGTHFTFEYGAAKLGGGQGFADVFKRGFFGWEYKGKHANLDKAYLQLLQYRPALSNPPLLVVSDTQATPHRRLCRMSRRYRNLWWSTPKSSRMFWRLAARPCAVKRLCLWVRVFSRVRPYVSLLPTC